MSVLLSGCCQPKDSVEWAASFDNPRNFVATRGLTLSSLGCGTYLGSDDDKTQHRVVAALRELIGAGLNVIDTAPNYRSGYSESAVGAAVRAACNGGVPRGALFLSTKVGILPEGMACDPAEILDGRFCYAPEHILASVAVSRDRLGVSTIDCLYLHNFDEAQTFLSHRQQEETIDGIVRAMRILLEREWIRYVGLATWDGLRVERDHPAHMDLVEWTRRFERYGLGDPFAFIQLPLGIWAPEALITPVQIYPRTGQPATALVVARELGLGVMANSSLFQGGVLAIEPPGFSCQQALSPAQLFVQWTRSVPEVDVTVVGMKSELSVREGREIMSLPKSMQVFLAN